MQEKASKHRMLLTKIQTSRPNIDSSQITEVFKYSGSNPRSKLYTCICGSGIGPAKFQYLGYLTTIYIVQSMIGHNPYQSNIMFMISLLSLCSMIKGAALQQSVRRPLYVGLNSARVCIRLAGGKNPMANGIIPTANTPIQSLLMGIFRSPVK